jgi:hypothetical protein
MSCSLDANILIYASDESSPFHRKAVELVGSFSVGADLLCLAWPTLMAYQRIVTHPRIFHRPLSPGKAWENVRNLLALPRIRAIGELPEFAEDYSKVTKAFAVRGNLVPDAHLATILRQHGVGVLYSADTDFRKFDFLKIVNPFD